MKRPVLSNLWDAKCTGTTTFMFDSRNVQYNARSNRSHLSTSRNIRDTPTSPNAAPATKSELQHQQIFWCATKSETPTSPNVAPATTSDSPTLGNVALAPKSDIATHLAFLNMKGPVFDACHPCALAIFITASSNSNCNST